jgi:hypothetical protein
MKKSVVSAAIALAALAYGLPAAAQERLARFEGGIGSQPFARQGVNTVVANDVQGVNPGGRPWVIERLSADIRVDGRISVDGRGLLLAGGNNVGNTGGQSVHARLFCGAVAHNSGTVPLEVNGDFRIEDQLTPVPPADCANPILLIVSGVAPAGNWFAAGIPKR